MVVAGLFSCVFFFLLLTPLLSSLFFFSSFCFNQHTVSISFSVSLSFFLSDPRLVNVALSCVNGCYIALTSLDAGDVLFRASVGLRVALLHEMGAEASFGREGGREEAGRRMRSAIQCARQTRDLVRVERARNVDAEWHARYIFIYIFFFFFFFLQT